MTNSKILTFLNQGDVSIQYQVGLYLTELSRPELSELKSRIAVEGFGKRLLSFRDSASRMWGNGIYSPKWVSTHYSLLELLNIGCDMSLPLIQDSIELLLDVMWQNKGEVRRNRYQDMCVSAMILQLSCKGLLESNKLNEMIDYILAHQFEDGGWNCAWQRGAIHSSLHTTICVLEAFRDYLQCGYSYRMNEIKIATPKAIEFLLKKNLFRSVRTHEIIDSKMLKMSFPTRWQYDVLRALFYLATIQFPYDPRMEEGIDYLQNKRTIDDLWKMETARPNKVHFIMEKNGVPSRWNTLRVLYVMKIYKPNFYLDLIQK